MEVSVILSKIKKHPLLLGTALLTGAGLISRILGFFYRIFLSRTTGASGLGLYQLIFPVFGLCLAISASGIQTAISRYVASSNKPRLYLWCGMLLSVSLSGLLAIFVYWLAPWIASDILKETRTTDLLRHYSTNIADIDLADLRKELTPCSRMAMRATVPFNLNEWKRL